MPQIQDILSKAETAGTLTREDLLALLSTEQPEDLQALYEAAYRVKLATVGNKVYFRGIVEFSNICRKDCYYCGIRHSNQVVKRFQMTHEEIVSAAVWAYENEYGSLVLQSGERNDDAFADFIANILSEVRGRTNGELGITLSLGEQTEDVYRRWFECGAHRYLLRIETTNPCLYAQLHPADHSWHERVACLERLRNAGYQVGTGVMIGLPGQTLADLANDLVFFKEHDIDMIGMGPYIVHQDTPMASHLATFDAERQLTLGLKMVAAARLHLRDVNIAATTALQALVHNGRELGLQAGANIIMPNVTDTKYRDAYQLYDNKPCTNENSSMCRGCLQGRVQGIGESIGFGEWGDSPHFFHRQGTERPEPAGAAR
jgi:biotin synthase